MSLMVSVDVKQHWTMLRHWSQFVPNMSTDIRGHEALHHHHSDRTNKQRELTDARGKTPHDTTTKTWIASGNSHLTCLQTDTIKLHKLYQRRAGYSLFLLPTSSDSGPYQEASCYPSHPTTHPQQPHRRQSGSAQVSLTDNNTVNCNSLLWMLHGQYSRF